MAGGDRESIDLTESDATITVVAHGLVGLLSVVKATAATLRDHYHELEDKPGLLEESLERMARNTDLAVDILEDLMRGIPPEILGVLDDLRRQ